MIPEQNIGLELTVELAKVLPATDLRVLDLGGTLGSTQRCQVVADCDRK